MKRTMVEIIVILAVIIGLFSMGMLFTYRSVMPFNLDEHLWIETADKISENKGLLEQSITELQITGTALQVQIFRSAFGETVNKFLIPIWAFVSLMGGTVIGNIFRHSRS